MKTQKLGNITKGFTLIELLVVIAILGVLAAALIAAINPIEQNRKSQDSSKQSIATEFNGAVQRYYTTHSVLPWDPNAVNPATGVTGACAAVTNGTAYQLSSAAMQACVGYLTGDGELKASFTSAPATIQQAIYVTGDTATGTVYSCFIPASNSQQTSSNTIYSQTGGAGVGCGKNTSACYWCS